MLNTLSQVATDMEDALEIFTQVEPKRLFMSPQPGRKSSCLLASDDDNEDCLGTPGGDASAAVQYTSSQQPYGSQTPATEKGKPYLEFKDAIHGFCKLHRDLKPWIDTSVFQV